MKVKSLRLVSIILALCLVLSCGVVAYATDAQNSTTDNGLTENVQDGVILHAFCWSYDTIKENLPAIAHAGYSTIQTSPVQQPKDRGPWENVNDQYWKPYQPLTYSIATNSWFGTKQDLTELCEEAHKYGIKIICDIVFNHLGNNRNGEAGTLDSNLANTLPEMYEDYYNFIYDGVESKYFHTFGNFALDNNKRSIVQGYVNNMVSVNTGSEYVQNLATGLLKECIDCGVDGFRFDAAKHIETPNDGDFASDFWPNVLGSATSYANETQNGKKLYYYGEILNTPGDDRDIAGYTEFMSVTDNRESNTVTEYIKNNNALSTYNMLTRDNTPDDDTDDTGYWLQAGSDKTVLWAESHDTYMGGDTDDISNENIVKSWALHASRKNATSLYFARPEILMGIVGDTTWKSSAVTEINKFHNAFVGEDEKFGLSGDFVYNQRGTKGMVIVNCNGTNANINISGVTMEGGTYVDTITGNTFTVSNGNITGEMGSSGVAVIYDGTSSPFISMSSESTSFKGETLALTVSVENVDSAFYQIGENEKVEFSNSADLVIGEGFDYGEKIPVSVTATKGEKSVCVNYYYTKLKPADTGVIVYFDNSRTQYENVYCYVADKFQNNDDYSVSNGHWPGEEMEYDEVSGLYYYEVPDISGQVEVPDGEGTKMVELSLLNSETAGVVFTNGAGVQYPAQSSKKSLSIGATVNGAKSFVMDAFGYKWGETSFVKGNSYGVLGNTNSDTTINIADATYIQKYLIGKKKLVSVALRNADVNNDGLININDVTLIQKYCVGMTTNTDIGVDRTPKN